MNVLAHMYANLYRQSTYNLYVLQVYHATVSKCIEEKRDGNSFQTNRELLTMLIQQQQQVTLRRAIMRKKILTSN